MKVLWVIVLFSCLPVFLVHGLHYKVCFSTFPHLIWSSLVWSGVIWSGLVLIRILVSSHSIASVEGDGGLSRCAYNHIPLFTTSVEFNIRNLLEHHQGK